MSGELNTLLYIICLLVLVVPIGFWTWKLRRGPIHLHRTLMWWYVAFAVSALCEGVHALSVCMAETFDWSLLMSVLTVGVLFLPPLLALLQKSIVEDCPINGQSALLYLFPSILYTTFVVYIRLLYGLDTIIATPWMFQAEVVGYYYILFLNIITGLSVVTWRYRKYHFRACNYYPDRNMSDDVAVRDITFSVLLVGAVVLFFLLASIETLHHNWSVTAVLIAIESFMLNYLGHALYSVKGNSIPTDIDWTDKTLTVEEITTLEERHRQANELLSAENATKNISSIIEKWVGQSNPSYLRAGITLTEAAYEMKIPANILSGYINKTLNTNFNQWINAYRIKHVKFLLLTTDNTLDEIAEASGFATRNLLSRTFKAHEGITPSEFRTKNRK